MGLSEEIRAIDGTRVHELFDVLWGPRPRVEQAESERFVSSEVRLADEIDALRALKEAFERHRPNLALAGFTEDTLDGMGAGIDVARTVLGALIAEEELGNMPPRSTS